MKQYRALIGFTVCETAAQTQGGGLIMMFAMDELGDFSYGLTR